MGQKLVIVESPAKAKTIKKYLGKNYVVEATMGHVRDLPKSQLGVDIENDFEPKYITIRGKGDVLSTLRKAAKKSDKVYLATDPDREGEAISWHLVKALKMDEKEKIRIEFNEITKTAVKNAIKNPREIRDNVVNAQQARRILDRLVGYEISPILWRKIKWGLSAGRVQSAALKIICDREEDIKAFEPKEYWTIEGLAYKDKKKDDFQIKLAQKNGKKIELNDEKETNEVLKELNKGKYIIDEIKTSKKAKSPSAPFTTSTLQQEAYKKLGYSTKRTMSNAQKLYEGIDIKGFGTVGLITYMRTDSVRISEEAQTAALEFIKENIGDKYIPEEKRIYKTKKKNTQDAHEAIRPSNVNITPEIAKDSLSKDEYKLYNLIWQRFMASQMSDCIMDNTTVNIINGDYLLKARGSVILFDGFTKIYSTSDEEKKKLLPKLAKDDILILEKMEGIQHFTQPPAKFSEASLVKTLEENGIGRPSTYSPTISTLLSRKYVERDKKTLQPTELGEIVNKIVGEYFKFIVDIDFTAELERKLDCIEEGTAEWRKTVATLYEPLKEAVEIAEKEIAKITIEDKVTDILCDKCGRNMVIKQGRFGEFLACPGYPECKNTKAITKELDVNCPLCGNVIVEKRSKKGKTFYGCSNYPECNYVSWYEPVNKPCPECGELLVKRYSKKSGEYLSCPNKECDYTEKDKN
ncbi:type I DNA topoisomerase [Oceanirhabdus sp. W0125-5]|uniref:type I DNA topoisomerase n=1 Tax=Oceanirhabdus sp. W0125-5 TaxID=2999116 RepID=UPI0022F32603|nr:type I DNA topoisomerase [Oceanirhabdus sp. W0125-5]WBW94819.1 type I DNA topoisomerase [Oceanirhabdus sp. W0125-5]